VTAAIHALRAVDARVLGSVFNMVPAKGEGSYQYDYGYSEVGGKRGWTPAELPEPTPNGLGALAGANAGLTVAPRHGEQE
jgi:hypothetical protein